MFSHVPKYVVTIYSCSYSSSNDPGILGIVSLIVGALPYEGMYKVNPIQDSKKLGSEKF